MYFLLYETFCWSLIQGAASMTREVRSSRILLSCHEATCALPCHRAIKALAKAFWCVHSIVYLEAGPRRKLRQPRNVVHDRQRLSTRPSYTWAVSLRRRVSSSVTSRLNSSIPLPDSMAKTQTCPQCNVVVAKANFNKV